MVNEFVHAILISMSMGAFLIAFGMWTRKNWRRLVCSEKKIPDDVMNILSGDFCVLPNEYHGKVKCIHCPKWFRVTIFGLGHSKVCLLHGVSHTLNCCDCYQKYVIERKKKKR